MAHTENLEKISALEPFCRLIVYDLGLSAPCRNALFLLESLPRRACLRNGWIGLISLSMMARVSLGHSGRSIHEPPSILTYALAMLISGIIFRVFFPLVSPEEYLTWIALAQVFWILAFGIFLLLYFPILTRPRIDGLPG